MACRASGIEIVEAAHPVPDAAGEAGSGAHSGQACRTEGEDRVLALIPGGGSGLLARRRKVCRWPTSGRSLLPAQIRRLDW